MLSYTDSPLFLRVYREDPQSRRRTRVAVVVKSTSEVRLDARAKATGAERSEIDEVIAKYRSAREVQARADVLRFPEVARAVSDYYASCSDALERKLIAGAVIEALRSIRKADSVKR
jgi:hypothetical protein